MTTSIARDWNSGWARNEVSALRRSAKHAAGLALLLFVAGTSAVQAQTAGSATPRPATSGAQASARPQLANIPQLCRFREQQIMDLVRRISERSQRPPAAPDQRQAASGQIRELIVSERELELSWDHLDCARILYGANR